MHSTPPAAPTSRSQRLKSLLLLTASIALTGGAWALYNHLFGQYYESTDNAYVQGNLIQIAPQIGGTVQAIFADDTDLVQAGMALVALDPTDSTVALQQAEAQLAQTVRQTRALYANNAVLNAQIRLRETEVMRAQTEATHAEADLQRRNKLSGAGFVSKEDSQHAQTQAESAKAQVATAQAGVIAANEQLSSNQALTAGIALKQHPSVLSAVAKMREAWLTSRRTVLLAPVDGYIAKRSVQLGQRVAPGTPLMTLIPLDQVWVEANFKENQLRYLRLGQTAILHADLYGRQVQYQGTVAGLGVGTGAAFALLPAQNATGNWIKVIQRVPVRITLDSQQLQEHPLRIGLSMQVTVNTRERSGAILAPAPRNNTVLQTDIYADAAQGADEEIARIIAANSGER